MKLRPLERQQRNFSQKLPQSFHPLGLLLVVWLLLSVHFATMLRKILRPVSKKLLVRTYVAPVHDVNFLVKDVYDFPGHYKRLGYDPEVCGEDLVNMVIDETAKFSENVIAPLNEVGDTEGCTYVDEHTVKTPSGFKEAYEQYNEGGWQGLSYPEEFGGQGMPQSMSLLHAEMLATACWSWNMYPGLSKGAINTIYAHCTDELKQKFMPRMVSGEWTGTMCLTEPQCGSDLAQVSTKAVPQPDGTYKITGTKIFISCGEHDMTNNIIHCVLARLPDAPPGIKGISLFLVPKHRVSDDGTISSEFNGANIGRIEDKMGCHGSSTCEINFEDAEGYLIGTEHKGMAHMFTFINTSRLGTSMQGVAAAENSYQNALAYCKERRSFRSLNGIVDEKSFADPLIVHGDIRKNLLFQRAISMGGRSMIYQCVKMADEMVNAKFNENDMKKHDEIDSQLGFKTPILKGFLTEMGVEAASLGMQLYGGHGYIKANKQEQIYRDVRISSIWEGTTGIQALDLLGRKIFDPKEKLKPIKDAVKRLKQTVKPHLFSNSVLGQHARTLYWKGVQWQLMTMGIGYKAMNLSKDIVGAVSVDFLMYSGHVTLAEHWFIMESVATEKIAKGEGNKEYYEAQIQTADYVFKHMLPRTLGLRQSILYPSDATINSTGALKAEHFSFDHSL